MNNSDHTVHLLRSSAGFGQSGDLSMCCVGELGGPQDVLSFMVNHIDGMINVEGVYPC